MKKSNPNFRKKIVKLGTQISVDDREAVKIWAERAHAIVSNKNLSNAEKVVRLQKLKVGDIVKPFLKVCRSLVFEQGWKNRSWASRMALLGGTTGIATFGSQMAGLAFAGGAIAIPLALVTAAGPTILGVIVDELTRMNKVENVVIDVTPIQSRKLNSPRKRLKVSRTSKKNNKKISKSVKRKRINAA